MNTYDIAIMTNQQWSPAALVHELFTAAQLAPGEGIENAVGRLAALVEAQQPAKAKSPRQILTAPENLPNQYGVEFGMSGQQMHFKIGHQLFRLAYKPDDQQEFEFMKRMLIHAFSTFTPDVKMAQRPTTHVQNPAEIEHVAGDVSKNGAESDVAQRPAPSAAADLIAALEEARRAINSMKVEAETAAQGDEQMMLEACETISNEGLQADMAIRAALASAPKPSPTPQAGSQPAPVRDYPPLPDFETVEQHIYGACRRYITQDMLEPIHNLIRDVIDADRAAKEGA